MDQQTSQFSRIEFARGFRFLRSKVGILLLLAYGSLYLLLPSISNLLPANALLLLFLIPGIVESVPLVFAMQSAFDRWCSETALPEILATPIRVSSVWTGMCSYALTIYVPLVIMRTVCVNIRDHLWYRDMIANGEIDPMFAFGEPGIQIHPMLIFWAVALFEAIVLMTVYPVAVCLWVADKRASIESSGPQILISVIGLLFLLHGTSFLVTSEVSFFLLSRGGSSIPLDELSKFCGLLVFMALSSYVAYRKWKRLTSGQVLKDLKKNHGEC